MVTLTETGHVTLAIQQLYWTRCTVVATVLSKTHLGIVNIKIGSESALDSQKCVSIIETIPLLS